MAIDDDGPLPTLLSLLCLRLSGSTLDPTAVTLVGVRLLSTQRVWFGTAQQWPKRPPKTDF